MLQFCAPMVKDRFFIPILACLADPEPTVRFWTCFALALMKDQRAMPELERLTDDAAIANGWWTVGGEAAWALAVIRGAPDANTIWNENSERRARE